MKSNLWWNRRGARGVECFRGLHSSISPLLNFSILRSLKEIEKLSLMVLADTSVWIRFLANRPPYTIELDRLLGLDEVTGHELVYGELLIGD